MRVREVDRADLAARGIAEAELVRQLGFFARPPGWVPLDRPCGVGDGITQLGLAEAARYGDAFDEGRLAGRCTIFVPASGAASRMFSGLVSARARVDPMTRDALSSAARGGDAGAQGALDFGENLERFPFFPLLAAVMSDAGLDVHALAAAGHYRPFVDYLIGDAGLGYAARPKGLLPFHVSGTGSRTALEAHLVEAGAYLGDASGVCRVHLTVSAEHLADFERAVAVAGEALGHRLGVRFDVGLSVQGLSTDTVAATLDNTPLRDVAGRLVFRPGGHGALLENLHQLGGDVVFIKNIDNIAPESMNGPTLHWKRVLGGCLIVVQRQVHGHLRALHGEHGEAAVVDALAFLRATFGEDPGPRVASGPRAERRSFAIARLDRPIRVCGMVPNQGQPGGGPFWVKGDDAERHTEIVESAQVDQSAPNQTAILAAATHFNPVDLVCGMRDWHDEPFDLRQFANPDRVFISEKSSGGHPIKALEHPGLWNGAMAGWLSLFVEVPPETFSPVKTVNDLLRQERDSELG